MKKRRKICVVTSSRADYNHLFLLISDLNVNKQLKFQLVATGMHTLKKYGYTYNEILNDGFIINKLIKTYQKDNSQKQIIKNFGEQFNKIFKTLSELDPDIIVILGDRYDIFPIAIVAHFMQIPLAHISGGELTYGVIDDGIRHSISKLSHLHFVSHMNFKKRLIQMGENPSNIYNVGSLGVESLKTIPTTNIDVIKKHYKIPKEKKYFVICVHPQKSLQDNKTMIANILKSLNYFQDHFIIFSEPNSDIYSDVILKKIREYVKKNKQNTLIVKSVGRKSFVNLLRNSSALIGNSSAGLVEAPSLLIPTINIGSRQLGRPLSGSVISIDHEVNSIVNAITKSQKLNLSRLKPQIQYKGKNSVQKVTSILCKTNLKNLINKKFNDVKFS